MKATSPLMSNRLYDALKWVAQILLPALGTFYFGLGELWHLPNVAQTVGTITLVDTFLGLLLGLATKQFNNSDAKYNGVIDIEQTAAGKQYSLALHSEPEHLDTQQEALFKINPPRAPETTHEVTPTL